MTIVAIVILAAPSLGPAIAVLAALAFDGASIVLVRLPHVTVSTFWVNALGSVLAIAGLSWVVIRLVFSPGPIDRHRIVGAVVLYLNIALLFTAFYRLIWELWPGSFTGMPADFGVKKASGDLMYFSMATLTTVGYGDIAPVHPLARSLANLEGLLGQLYPAIILARVVGLYVGRPPR
ncbi:potassium channel family protein [Rhodopila sp.]|uniref:potassium channel family protein n=1 Tax=Rhodopila sp. TaxID=2480087 RepID=UPI002D7E9BDF|nr:potassium channel family protein [Rhodopila sp.]